MSKLSACCGLMKLLHLQGRLERSGLRRCSQRYEQSFGVGDHGTVRRTVFGEELRGHEQRNRENYRHRRVRDLMRCTHVLRPSGPFQTENRKALPSFQILGKSGNGADGRAGRPPALIGSSHRG